MQRNIHFAAVKGDLQLLSSILQENVSVNSLNKDNQTPLHRAVIWKKETIVDKLLSSHASIDMQDRFGNTALIYACTKAHTNITEKLIQHKADLNLKNDEEKTALSEAVRMDSFNVVYLFLINNAEIHNVSTFYHYIRHYILVQNMEQEIQDSSKIIFMLEKLYAKMLNLPDEEKLHDLKKDVKTYLDKFNKIMRNTPEIIWESMSAFPLEHGKVPMDVANLCLTYLGFFKGKYKTETELKKRTCFTAII